MMTTVEAMPGKSRMAVVRASRGPSLLFDFGAECERGGDE